MASSRSKKSQTKPVDARATAPASASPAPADKGWAEAELALARRHDAELQALVARRRRDKARIAYLLVEVRNRRLHESLGFADLIAYALDRGVERSPTQVRQLVALVERLAGLAIIRKAFQSGQVDWTKAREIARVAQVDDQEDWLAKAKKMTSREIERLVSKVRGEPDLIRVTLTFTPEQHRLLKLAIHAVRALGDPRVTDAEAVGIISRAWTEGSQPNMSGRPTTRIVLYKSEAGDVTMETPDGPVKVSPASAEQAACNAEVLDIRRGPGRLTRTVPPRIARFVLARDRGRCKVDGCGNMGFVHIHHEPGRHRVGHDPTAMLLLCVAHHGARHEGRLQIEVTRSGFRFTLADGTVLGQTADSPGKAIGARASKGNRPGRTAAAPRRRPGERSIPAA